MTTADIIFEPCPVDRRALTYDQWTRAAERLGVERAMLRAIAIVEAPLGAFHPRTGVITTLFERHKFDRFTKGQFRAVAPDLSSPIPGGYGRNSEQPGRVRRAMALSHGHALAATSWGFPQTMGSNHEMAGHPSAEALALAYSRGALEQLEGFVAFLDRPEFRSAMRHRQFSRVARLYNGVRFADHDYHIRLGEAYQAALKEFPRPEETQK